MTHGLTEHAWLAHLLIMLVAIATMLLAKGQAQCGAWMINKYLKEDNPGAAYLTKVYTTLFALAAAFMFLVAGREVFHLLDLVLSVLD